MEYNKYCKENYNLHIIKTDNFKKIMVSIVFRRELKKEEVTKRSVLVNTLIDSNKNYNSSRLLEIETENLYGLGISFNVRKSGKVSMLNFSAQFLNEVYTEKNMNEKSIKFLLELLFNPNVDKEEFNEKSFLLSKKIVENNIISLKDSASFYSNVRILEEINSNNPMSFRKAYIEQLDKITRKELYNYYLDVIENDIVDIFVVGDVEEHKIIEIFEKNIKLKDRQKKHLNHFSIENKINKDILTKEILPVKQSIISVAYVIDELNDFEINYVLKMFSFILGESANSKLFKNIREKNSLCYNISSTYNTLTGLIIIKAGIDKENFELVKSLIEKEIDNMKKGKFSINDLKNGKKSYKNSYISMADSLNSILNLHYSYEFIKSDSLENKIINMEKVTKEDIIYLASKIHLSKIFFLEGDESIGKEENN